MTRSLCNSLNSWKDGLPVISNLVIKGGSEYKLEFDEASHTYTVDGVVRPGITDILKKSGISKDYDGVDTFYRDRGTAVHLAVKFFLKGTLDESTLDPICVPYLEGFKAWLYSFPETTDLLKASEIPLYSQRLGFCGTLDLVFNGFIFDMKCSKDPDPASEVQGAAQQILWEENFGVGLPFRVLQLPGDGTYNVINYAERVPASPNLWEGVMEVYRWKCKAYPGRGKKRG